MSGVETQVGVVHGAEGVWVVGFVFLDVGLVDPLKGVHEPIRVSLKNQIRIGGMKKAYISSRVGVIYRIKLMRKKGTCRTEFAIKSNPPTSLSSQVADSKSMTNESIHSRTFVPTIYKNPGSISKKAKHRYCPRNRGPPEQRQAV